MLFLLWAVADPDGFSEFLVVCVLAVVGIAIGLHVTLGEIMLVTGGLLLLWIAGKMKGRTQ